MKSAKSRLWFLGRLWCLRRILALAVLVAILVLSAGVSEVRAEGKDPVLTELKRLHESIEAERKNIARRTAQESDEKGRFNSIPTEFAQFVWKDPQSFYTWVVGGSLQLISYGIAWKRMQLNVAMWKNQIETIDSLKNEKFELTKSDAAAPQKTSFRKLYIEWLRAEKDLAASLAKLSKEEMDLWLQSDRVSPEVKRMALELKAKIGSGADSAGDALAGKLSNPETANANHSNAYENFRRAVVEQKVPEIVKAASGRTIPSPKPLAELLKDAGAEMATLPVGEGRGIAIGGAPGARALTVAQTLDAVRNVESSANRKLMKGRNLWRRASLAASLPALLIAVPVVSIAISRYHDSLLVQENRLEIGEAARKKDRDVVIDSLVTSLPKPFLSMVVASWSRNPRLKYYAPPVSIEPNAEIYNPDLDFISGIVTLSILEMELSGHSIREQDGTQSAHFRELLTLVFDKLIHFARKWNPALNRIDQDTWETKIIPDLVDSGEQLFGALPVGAAPLQPGADQLPVELKPAAIEFP